MIDLEAVQRDPGMSPLRDPRGSRSTVFVELAAIEEGNELVAQTRGYA